MRKHLVIAAAIAALSFVSSPVPQALAQTSFCFGSGFACRDMDPFGNNRRDDTNFDLGIDVSNVPLTRPGVSQFMASLSPEGQHIMLRTCQNYLGNPSQVQSPRTIQFCRALLGA